MTAYMEAQEKLTLQMKIIFSIKLISYPKSRLLIHLNNSFEIWD